MTKYSNCLYALDHRTFQTHPCFHCHRNPEGCTHHLPPRGKIWSRMVSKNDKDDKWGKHILEAHPSFKHLEIPISSFFFNPLDCVCQVIRARVKDLMIPRYKIVVLVHIGQLCDQSMQISSRCLWDSTNDTFATYSFKNSSLFGVGTVYAVYYEWIAKAMNGLFWNYVL